MKFRLCIFLIACMPFCAQGQLGYELLKHVKKIEIPFEYKNNLIVVNVTINRIFPLKFIYDTGAEHTILAQRDITDILGVRYEREFNIMGSDLQTELTAYLVRGIHLGVEDMVLPYHSILVLDEDYFRFDQIAGLDVHGILGADVFRGLVVKINYQKKTLTIVRKQNFKKLDRRNYTSVPIEVHNNKPYINTNLDILPDSTLDVKLLFDTGAMVTLLLNTNTHPQLKLPPNVVYGTIGAGLGGFLEGYLGRVDKLAIGDIDFQEVLTNFQDISQALDTTYLYGRNGILGNQILSRFNWIIDYPGETLYYQPNRKFKQKFEYDKSGLHVIAADLRLRSFIVSHVIEGSPAEEAGIQKGDEIVRINFTHSGFLSLEFINHVFRKREGKKINIVIIRDGNRMKKTFRLRRLI